MYQLLISNTQKWHWKRHCFSHVHHIALFYKSETVRSSELEAFSHAVVIILFLLAISEWYV